ncbi:MAG TPA: hypothetical protein ENI64_07895 [Gammaproteobacteria bacterium]|nr:hypothetical protein [Gammaproteobacteria bacterium]
MDVLLLSLIAWLNLYTEYDTRVELPNIVITDQANMCRQYGIHDKGTCEATNLRGFYNKKLTIYLNADFDRNDAVDQSRLMHELVHFIQWHNGSDKGACWGQLEVEAYTLQDEWGTQHDLSQTTDPFKLIMLDAACDV